MKNGSKEREGEDLAQENRRASVLALYSKNLNQEEIAQELKVDQSTISRDMRHLREEAKRKIIDVTDNLSFEFLRYLAVTDEIARELWKLASKEHPLNNNSANTGLSARANQRNKNRIGALALLRQLNEQRIQAITGGTRSTHDFTGATIMNHGREIKEAMKTPAQIRREQEEEDRRLFARMG